MDLYMKFFTQFFFGLDVVIVTSSIVYFLFCIWVSFFGNPKNVNYFYFILFLTLIFLSVYIFIDFSFLRLLSNQQLTSIGFSINILNVCLFFYTVYLHIKLNEGKKDSKPTLMLLFFVGISLGFYFLILWLFNQSNVHNKPVQTVDEQIAALSTCISIFVTGIIVLFFVEERHKLLKE